LLEGKGVQPDCSIPNEQAGARDAQLERAVDVAAINQSLLAIVLPITNIPYLMNLNGMVYPPRHQRVEI
jgi:hypothetical protein